MVNNSCIRKNSWELVENLVEYLLIYCSYAYIVNGLLSFVFSLFGVSWMMPKHVMELLVCWNWGIWLASDSSYLGG